MRYKQQVAKRTVDLIDANHTEDGYRVDLRLAAICEYDIWAIIKNDIISNFWKKLAIV